MSDAPEDLSVGDSAPPYVVEDVDRVDFARYAGASGDFNRIHVDEAYATDAGHRSVFGHGMLTAGFVSSYVADWFGLANVSRLRTRFESRLWPGDTVRVTGEVTDRTVDDDAITLEVSVTAENGDGETLVAGDATIEL